MAGTAFGSAPQDGQSPKQDMKDTGKAVNKTADKTPEGAQKVKDKTDPN